jgi:low temperature requirement protein LtrA
VYGAIAALSVAIELAFEHSHQTPVADATRWCLAGAVALYLTGSILVRASAQPDRTLLLVHVVAIAVVLLVAVSASSWPGSAVMTSLAVILLAVLVSKQVVRAKRGDLRPDVED